MTVTNGGPVESRLGEFAPLAAVIAVMWIAAGVVLWAADISEPFIWYTILFIILTVIVELATGSALLSVPEQMRAVILLGFFDWIVLFAAFLVGWL